MKLLRQQRGDTIVEVLIAVAMLAFVITTASATTTRSSNTVRASQERGEALKLAQSQVEYIISKQGLTTGKECFNSSGEPKEAGDKECAYSAGDGSGCEISTKGYCYNVNIEQTRTSPPPTANDPTISMSYTVHVDWDSLDGDEDTVAIVYKMLLPNPIYVAPYPPPGAGGSLAEIAQEEGDKTCVLDNSCPSTGKYRYRRSFTITNFTNLNPADIQSCLWTFGDGQSQPVSASNCEVGDGTSHDFPEDPRYPEGDDCQTGGNFQKTPYDVKLIVTKKSGSKVTTLDTETTVPFCTQ